MKKPTLKNVSEYFQIKGSTHAEAENFFDYYESNGWKVGGRAAMKSWTAAANRWMRNSFDQGNKSELKYREVIAIHSDPKDQRQMSDFIRNSNGLWSQK